MEKSSERWDMVYNSLHDFLDKVGCGCTAHLRQLGNSVQGGLLCFLKVSCLKFIAG